MAMEKGWKHAQELLLPAAASSLTRQKVSSSKVWGFFVSTPFFPTVTVPAHMTLEQKAWSWKGLKHNKLNPGGV